MPSIFWPQRMHVVPWIVALVGCGRIAFDTGVSDAGLGDDSGSSNDALHDDVAEGPDGSVTPWQMVQVAGTETPTLTVAPTAAGHLIVVGIQMTSADTVTSVTDDASNTYARIAAAHATDGVANDGIDVWYAQASNAGATTIAVAGPTVIYAIVGWEFSGIATTNALADAIGASNQASSLTPTSPVITTARTGELVLAFAVTLNDVTGIHGGNEFTNDSLAAGSGWAHITSDTAPAGTHVAQWDHNTNTPYLSSVVAFVTP